VRLAAARTGQELNSNSLASDAGISQPTAREWLTALQVGFLVAVFPSHLVNYSRRLRKRPRLHFLDSGLVCYLLGITDPQQLERHPLRGAIFESVVAAELRKAFENSAREPPLFFWRDATGHEIDIPVDLGSRLVPVDVKSGATVASDYLDGLKWWTGLKGNPNTGGVLVYGGNEARSREGFEIRPWFLQ
jgi:predicted AAA+ superfamily ATPase